MYNTGFGRFSGYTYENMENDLELFEKIFPGILSVDSLGKTADEREIYHLTAGRREAQDKILIFGGIHGREYMTSQLIMEQTAEFLSGVLKGRASAMHSCWKEAPSTSFPWQILTASPSARWDQEGSGTESLGKRCGRLQKRRADAFPAVLILPAGRQTQGA